MVHFVTESKGYIVDVTGHHESAAVEHPGDGSLEYFDETNVVDHRNQLG